MKQISLITLKSKDTLPRERSTSNHSQLCLLHPLLLAKLQERLEFIAGYVPQSPANGFIGPLFLDAFEDGMEALCVVFCYGEGSGLRGWWLVSY
jgi:hypothetical protein